VDTVHECDRQTDRRTDGQNYDHKYCATHSVARITHSVGRITFCRGAHGEMTAKNGSIPSRNKKRISNLKECDRQTEGQRDRQTESIVDNNRLLGLAQRSTSDTRLNDSDEMSELSGVVVYSVNNRRRI